MNYEFYYRVKNKVTGEYLGNITISKSPTSKKGILYNSFPHANASLNRSINKSSRGGEFHKLEHYVIQKIRLEVIDEYFPEEIK